MTDVICTMDDCIHRSKRTMRKCKMRNGSKCYKCTLDIILVIDEETVETEELFNREFPCCARYKRKEV